MKIETTRFGEIEVPEDRILELPDGILGFPDVRRYALLENPSGGPFLWLQAAEVPALAFVVCDPRAFFPDYEVQVRAEDLERIRLTDAAGGLILVILTVPSNPREITANLLGPLILNTRERMAQQVVISDARYTTKHRIFPAQ